MRLEVDRPVCVKRGLDPGGIAEGLLNAFRIRKQIQVALVGKAGCSKISLRGPEFTGESVCNGAIECAVRAFTAIG